MFNVIASVESSVFAEKGNIDLPAKQDALESTVRKHCVSSLPVLRGRGMASITS